MDRFFLAPEQWTPGSLRLGGEEGHHAVRVMRKKVGDQIELFDGAGRWARGGITEVNKANLLLEIESEGRDEEAQPQMSLVVAIPKGKTMDLIVQKAVELGVNSIQPITTTNTVVKLKAGEGEGEEKARKWQRVALEASKQCGQNFLPQVAPVRELTQYLAECEDEKGSRMIASLAPGARLVREVLEELPASTEQVFVLVGPEGDFTSAEVVAATRSGFAPVSLGKIVLRVETAALFLLSAIRYRFGS